MGSKMNLAVPQPVYNNAYITTLDMKKSLRSIGTTVFILGAMLLSVISAHELTMTCTGDQAACAAAGVIFGIPDQKLSYEGATARSQTTQGTAPAYPSVFSELMLLLKTVGVYLVFLGVVILVVLEIIELHYIRMLLGRKRA